MDTLLLIDGNAIMHRAFHALPPFKTKAGIPTHVVYGFFSMLYKAANDFAPTHIVVCFDTPKPTFRNFLFKEYQAQRPKIADDFITQIPLLKDALDKAGIFQIEKDGYEADDLIGTIAHSDKVAGSRVIILTGDRDILQLVKDKVFVASPTLGLSNIKMYDEAAVLNKYDLPASSIPDLKALMGDPSDNYTGAKGIGPKTAAKLLKVYGSVENLLTHTDKLDEKTRKILNSCRSDIEIAKKLAQIDIKVPLEFDMNRTRFEKFNEELKKELLKLEMSSLSNRFFSHQVIKKPVIKEKKKDEKQMGLF